MALPISCVLFFCIFASAGVAEQFNSTDHGYFIELDGRRHYCGPRSICNPLPTGDPDCITGQPSCPPSILEYFEENGEYLLPQFRPVVALTNSVGDTVCTGTLISSNHVLTAAHCLCPNLEAGRRPANIVYGRDARQPISLFPVDFMADSSFFSDSFCASNGADLDLGVLFFPNPAEFPSEFIAPLDFSGNSSVRNGIIAGFGFSDSNYGNGIKDYQVYENVTLCSEVSVEGVNNCLLPYNYFAGEIGSEQGGCYGDSGSPLISFEGAVIGVYSRGAGYQSNKPEYPCGNGDIFAGLGGQERNGAGQTIPVWINQLLSE